MHQHKRLRTLTSFYSDKQNVADILICVPSKFINLGIIRWVRLKHYKLIAIRNEQLENFKFKDCLDPKNHLLISEFNI